MSGLCVREHVQLGIAGIGTTSQTIQHMKRILLGALAYVLPTFPLGYFWHLKLFAAHYRTLEVYREQVIIPFGILSMVIQGLVWSFVYARLFSGQSVIRGALRFAALAFPLAWSFMVLAVCAKHRMASVAGYMTTETAFILLHYAIVSPLIAAAHRFSPVRTP